MPYTSCSPHFSSKIQSLHSAIKTHGQNERNIIHFWKWTDFS